MSDVVFLVNPASGNGATGRRWPDLRRRADAAGVRGDGWLSDGPGAIADLAERAAGEGVPVVAVVGGDGTVHEAVNGLMRTDASRRPQLALLPQGSGDDFARALGVRGDEAAALAVVREGAVRELDVGRADYAASDGSRATGYFASMAGTGMSGAVARRLNETTKALGGRTAGLLATLAVFRRWQNVDLTVDIDGEPIRGRMEDVLVANTEFHNGGMRLCPGAAPDDGIFDVLLIGDVTKRDLALNLPKLYRGTFLPHPRAELRRGRRIGIESETALPIELDGEQPGTTPVTFGIVPRALKVRVPAGRPTT